MSKKSYYELLKDPRWQKKRLEVLERAGFECSNCGETKKTLHVHHGAYIKGLDPWDYPDSALHCICEDCHDQATTDQQALYKALTAIRPEHYPFLTQILVACRPNSRQKEIRKAMEAFCQMADLDERVFVPMVKVYLNSTFFRSPF